MLPKKSITYLFILGCTLALPGCFMVGPDFSRPSVKSGDQYQATAKTQFTESLGENSNKILDPVEWWQSFNDPTLNALLKQAAAQNLTLQQAAIRIYQLQAQLGVTDATILPTVALSGSYANTRNSNLQEITNSPGNLVFNNAVVQLNWELDFWGKYRRAIQSNDAAFLASVAAYDNAIITLTSDTATTYTKIRTTEKQITVTNSNIVVQKQGLRIALARYNAGEVSQVDVEQAKTELAQTQASLPPLISELQTQKDTLAVLLGTVPNGVDSLLKKTHGIPKAPYSIAVGIPIETIARRPDIHQARLQAVQQGAAIGAIKAQLYPALSLLGSFTFSSSNIGSTSISDMFNWSNRTITAGPSVAWSLLNYGQITNAVRVQDAVFQQALLAYINLVLQAQKEVQDNITAYVQAKAAVYYLTKANSSATQSLKLAIVRYKEGETDFTPVLNAEQQLLSVQTSLVKAQGNIPQALIALYRALGGGWQIRNTNDVIPQNIKAEMAARTNWGTLLKQQNHLPPMTKAQRLQQLYLPKW